MAPFPPSCSAVLPMSAQEYYAERDSAAFRTLMAAVLDLGEVKWVAQWRDGDKGVHKLVTSPDYEKWVPKAGRKFIKKEDLDFFDTITYDPELLKKPPFRLPVTSELALLGDKLVASRTIVIEEVDATHCRHSVTGEVKVKIFGIGKLAENSVVDSTVKTFAALPMVVERYLEVRAKMMASPQGRAALLEGRPEGLDQIDQHILGPLQTPYAKISSADLAGTASTETADEEEDEYTEAEDEVEEAEGSGGGSRPGARQLTRMETQYFDADDDLQEGTWEELVYQAEGEQDEGEVSTTNAAIKHDRNRVRRALDKMHERHASRRVSKLGRKQRRESKEARGTAEDQEEVTRRNLAQQAWQEYWRDHRVAVAPVPNFAGRVVNVMMMGHMKGMLEIVTLGAYSDGEKTTEPAATGGLHEARGSDTSSRTTTPIGGLLNKLRLRKH